MPPTLARFARSSTRPILGLALLCALAACGGGGSAETTADTAAPIGEAPQVAPGTYQVNPAATWKPLASNQDYFGGSLASVALSDLGATSSTRGELRLTLSAVGNFRYNAVGDLANAATGLFVDAEGRPVAPMNASPARPSPSASADCGQPDLGDAFPEDFLIPTDGEITLTVPATATALRLSVSDCYYKDNSLGDDPLRVTLTVR